MLPATENYLSPDEILRNAQCLLGHIEAVRRVLRRKDFSEHAIDHAVTAIYRAAMPYITGRKPCPIKNRRAWVFKVAFRAAGRAAMRDVPYCRIEPAALTNLAATVSGPEVRKAPFNLRKALSQLTAQQSQAIKLCVLRRQPIREAAKSMRISRSTLWGHLCAGKKRLKVILAHHEPQAESA